jgi:hypothetical protein
VPALLNDARHTKVRNLDLRQQRPSQVLTLPSMYKHLQLVDPSLLVNPSCLPATPAIHPLPPWVAYVTPKHEP